MTRSTQDVELAPEEVIPYLLRKRLLRPEDVVDRGILVEDTSRRNRNFKVAVHEGPAYVIKQGAYAETAPAITREGSIYRTLHGLEPLRRYLPACRLYDAERRILVLDYVRDAEDLRSFHLRRRRFPADVARLTGEALGTLHRLMRGSHPPDDRDHHHHHHDGAPGHHHAPWAFFLHRPNFQFIQSTSAANVRLIRVIQQFAEFRHLLDHAAQSWTPSTLTHNDVKWDNFLVRKQEDGALELRVIDWELAETGDPCWDAGSVFNDYMVLWLTSVPITGETPPERFLELTRFPLERMQPAMRAYWDAYAEAAQLDAAAKQEQMLKAVTFAAVRLVQSAYEQLQVATELTGNVVCMLQLSWNILQRPAEAAGQLLGLHAIRPSVAA